MEVTINGGLGTGSRGRDMQMLNLVKQDQMISAQMLAETGAMQESLGMLPKIMSTMTKIAESAGLKNAEDYYPQIGPEELQGIMQQAQQKASQPDPKIQADMQKAQMQIEASKQSEQAKAQASIITERAQLEADMATKDADRQNALIIEQQKNNFTAVENEKDRALQWNIELLKLNRQAESQERGFAQEDKARDTEMRAEGKHPQQQDALNQSLAGLAKALRSANGPKRVVRGADGRVESVESVPMDDEEDGDPIQSITNTIKQMGTPKRVVRGADGRAEGIETVN